MRNKSTLEIKMSKFKGAFDSVDDVETAPEIVSLPDTKILTPDMKIEEKSSIPVSLPKNEKLVNISETSTQKYLEFIPITARLTGDHIDFLTKITRKINQERRMNAHSIKNLKRERITDQSLLRALLDTLMSQIRECSFDDEIILNERDLCKSIERKIFTQNRSLQ